MIYLHPEQSELLNDPGTTACFTGHRPEHIPFDVIQNGVNKGVLTNSLYFEAHEAYHRGYRTFVVGMADGVDTFAGEAVVKLRDTFMDVRLVAVLPFKNQSGHNDGHYSSPRFKKLLDDANEVISLSDEYYSGCFYARNRFMVNHSSLLIAATVDKKSGGTAQTVKYAEGKGVEIAKINLKALKKELGLKNREVPRQTEIKFD